MRILSAITGLAITTVAACAAVASLSLPPTATSPIVALTAFAAAVPVLSHECPDCGGSDHCKHCIGTGADGSPLYPHGSCSKCKGTGTCQSCLEPEPLKIVPGGKQ